MIHFETITLKGLKFHDATADFREILGIKVNNPAEPSDFYMIGSIEEDKKRAKNDRK